MYKLPMYNQFKCYNIFFSFPLQGANTLLKQPVPYTIGGQCCNLSSPREIPTSNFT